MATAEQQYFGVQNLEILNSSPDLVFRLNSDGVFLEYFANDEVLFTEPQNFLGNRLDKILPAEIAKPAMLSISKALNSRRPQTFNYQMIVTGTLRSYEARIIPVDTKESIVHIHDITDQLLTKNLLRSQKELVQGICAASDLNAMLSLCLETALSLAKLDCGTIYLVDEQCGSINLFCHRGFSDAFAKKAAHYDISSSQGRIVMAGEPYYVDYQVLAGRLNNSENEENLRGSAIIPVKSGNRVIAAFLISSRIFEVIPEMSRCALETIASFIGSAIEHSKQQQELFQSQKQLKALFDSIEDSLVIIDRNGVVISTNPVVTFLLGYPPDYLDGKQIVSMYPEELHEKISSALQSAIAGEKVSCVVPVITAEGMRILMETRFYRADWGNREVFIGISRDIRKLVSMAVELNQEKSFTDTAIDVQMDMFICVELPSGKLVRWNKAFSEVTGYTDGEIVLMSTLECYFGKEDMQRVSLFFEELSQCGTGSIEAELLCINGRKVLTEFKVALVKHGQNPAAYLVAVGRDISQRKAIEITLRKSEMFLNEAQKLARIGHWCYNVHNAQIEWSDELFSIFGIDKSNFEMSVENIERMIHPDDLSGYIKCREKIVYQKEGMEFECRIIRPDNEVRTVVSRIKLIEDDTGNVIFVIGTFQDVTESKLMKEALCNTQRLESLGVLAAGIAHDFNNLLCGIYGNLELMKQLHTGDEEAGKYFDRILNSYQRTRDLTLQLQTFSKGCPLSKTTVNVNDILNEACTLALTGSNVECEITTDPSIPLTYADANQLNQVFNNILINARQALPSGGKIIVQTGNREIQAGEISVLESGRYIETTIIDNGCGISLENINKVFDPFFTTKQTGSGLGLAISHSIIRKHGGNIEITSEKNQGTVVTILLPVFENTVKEIVKRESPQEKMSGRILLMDDEEIACVVAQEMLMHIGFDVVCTNDGHEALAVYHREKRAGKPFSLVLLDLTVPGGFGGQEIMEEIRKIDPVTPGIIVSGYIDSPVLANPRRYGFTAKVDKPYQLEDLWRTVGEVISGTVCM